MPDSKEFPEAITSVFPKTVVQTCIVHLLRYSMHFASWKEQRPVAAALKPIYQAESAAAAQERLYVNQSQSRAFQN